LDQHRFAEASQGLIYVLTKATTCKEAVCLPKPFWRLKISAAQMLLKKTLCNSTPRISEGWENKKIWLGQSSVVLCDHTEEAGSFHVFVSC